MFQFFADVKNELSKVIWPTASETVKYTLTVILFSIGVAVILGAFDLGLTKLIAALVAK
jgi:preprotein translocase subunit SecE